MMYNSIYDMSKGGFRPLRIWFGRHKKSMIDCIFRPNKYIYFAFFNQTTVSLIYPAPLCSYPFLISSKNPLSTWAHSSLSTPLSIST